MYFVKCRFHDNFGNVWYFRSTDERDNFAHGMIEEYLVDGGTLTIFEGDHDAAIDQYLTIGDGLIDKIQMGRLTAHMAESGYQPLEPEPAKITPVKKPVKAAGTSVPR